MKFGKSNINSARKFRTPTPRAGEARNPFETKRGVFRKMMFVRTSFLREHAMKTFLARFAPLIHFVLSGFDRLRFRGESILLSNQRGVDAYLFRQQIRYVNFIDHCEHLTHTLCQQTDQLAQSQGVPLKHLNSPKIDKEATALELAAAQPCSAPAGRIALITAVESCFTYRLRKNTDGRAYPVKQEGKCKHYYHYFQHPELGLCYVRVQTYFPFTIRVGVNGRHWLYQQLRNRHIAFEHRGNLLLSVADIPLAQQLLDAQVHADYAKILGELVEPLQPLSEHLHTYAPYYWMAEQTEWANDFVFHSADDLATWYKRWVRHGIENLNCTDVLKYLGKKRPSRCKDEAKIDLRERPEGTRLKFWYGTNSLKMYDKESISFRPETTVNQPKEFQVFGKNINAGPDEAAKWRPMRKGVVDMERRAEVSQAANNRLLESLATVAETETLGELLKGLGEPVIKNGKRLARALNPLTGKDGELLRILARGNFLIKGFRNQDVREALYGKTEDAKERQRQAAAVTRLLALVKGHELIVKVQKSHRYHVSAAGRRTVTALLTAHGCDATRLAGGE